MSFSYPTEGEDSQEGLENGRDCCSDLEHLIER